MNCRITSQTMCPGMTSVVRYGGDIDMLKRMVAAGFPVVVEKGIYETGCQRQIWLDGTLCICHWL